MSARKACVIGWPAEHSRSPLIHTYWLKHYGIDGAYQRMAVPPEGLEGFVSAMQAQGYAGANVTIPHKAAVAHLCDRLTARSEKLGVVNTIWFDGDDMWGDTTDGDGFLAALDEANGKVSMPGAKALVLGAGGAVPAIVDALTTRAFEVTIANRTPAKAEAVAARFGVAARGLDAVDELLATTSLLVNATAAGLKGEPLALDLRRLHHSAVVYDITYVPRVTPLLRDAHARGLRTIGGLGMLLHQAVPGFERWFGVKPDVTDELRAMLEADVDGGR